MSKILGIGKASRRQLGQVLVSTKGAVTAADVSRVLEIPAKQAANFLGRLTQGGWMMRVQRGIYLPVPLEATTPPTVIEDPWVVAEKLFAPCYIGGWSAAHHWGFTDQLFQTVVVISGKRQNVRDRKVRDVRYAVKVLSKDKLFGTVTAWQDGVAVAVSDPTRTIVDILSAPKLGGGILSAAEMIEEYLCSEHFNAQLLIEYAERLRNRTVFKRLGFFVEFFTPDEHDLLQQCRKRMSRGYSQLDPAVKGKTTSARWRLYLPDGL